jgi:hypothetical protein
MPYPDRITRPAWVAQTVEQRTRNAHSGTPRVPGEVYFRAWLWTRFSHRGSSFSNALVTLSAFGQDAPRDQTSPLTLADVRLSGGRTVAWWSLDVDSLPSVRSAASRRTKSASSVGRTESSSATSAWHCATTFSALNRLQIGYPSFKTKSNGRRVPLVPRKTPSVCALPPARPAGGPALFR